MTPDDAPLPRACPWLTEDRSLLIAGLLFLAAIQLSRLS